MLDLSRSSLQIALENLAIPCGVLTFVRQKGGECFAKKPVVPRIRDVAPNNPKKLRMKRLIAHTAAIGAVLFLAVLPVAAQDAPGFHQVLKEKFIEGSAFFMSWIAAAFVIGLAFCIERIIYLSLAEVDTKRFTASVERALEEGDVDGAKDIARCTRGPVASIYYQGLMRIDQGVDVVEKSVVAYGGVQAGYLEKGCSWITLFIAMAPSLGFLGTVIGMVQAFDKIQQVGDGGKLVVDSELGKGSCFTITCCPR